MTHLETEPSALPPPTPETPPADRRWARSDDRVILGVAGGLGRALAIDPLLIRIAFVVLALFSGVGIAVYVGGWLLLADSPRSNPPGMFRRIVGIAVILLSARWLLGGGAELPDAGWVIAIGLLGAAVALWRGRTPAEQHAVPLVVDAAEPAEVSTSDRWSEWAEQRRNRRREQRSALGLLTIGAATVVGASVWLIVGDVSNRGALTFGWATVVIGCGLVVGAFVGRARWLIVPAVLTSIAALAASALAFADVGLNRHSHDRTVVLGEGSTVANTYRTGLGDFDLVLSDYPHDVTTRVEIGIGHLTVIVPDDAHVQVDSRVGLGSIDVLGTTTDGYRRALVVNSNPSGSQLIKLTLRVGIGDIEVRRGTFFVPDVPLPPITVPQFTPNAPAAKVFADGTVLYADGSIGFDDGRRIEPDGSYQITIVEQRPDGSVQLDNGAVVRADGTVVTPGGFVIKRDQPAPSSTTPSPTSTSQPATTTTTPASVSTGVQP
jgi:phage shock protein PspC (stress-responsive transcriptional regulator)